LPPALIDIGVNLAHGSYDADRPQVIERALAAGIGRMVVTGSSLESTRNAIALVHEYPQILRATAGVHPHHASDLTAEQLPELKTLMRDDAVDAAGECGLDHYRNYSPHDAQERALRWQLELAVELSRPVFLHQRDAHPDFMRILGDYLHGHGNSSGSGIPAVVVHCFTGTRAELDDYLAAGFSIGITGWIADERRGQHLKELVRAIPEDRLMLETDGPYLLPRDLRPKPASRRNEPMYLAHVLQAVARARDEEPARVAAATTRNAARFFGWKETI
jgi:TatD DNase family protein